MAFSGGTFSRTFDCTTDRDNGVKILASKFDTELDGMATGLSTCILKDGTQTCTAAIPFAEGLTVPDNKTIILGTNSDITIQYDESTNDSLEIAANVEGAALGIVLKADQGDDNADQHKVNIADGGTLTMASKISGSFVSYLTHTPNSTVASSTTAVAGNLTVGGDLTLGSGAVISEAELEKLDGITNGTVAADKAVVVDSNKDIASFRNVTLTGELDAGSLDISGDADIDGTLEADAMTLNGTAITATATLDTGISNNNVPKFTSGVADNDFLRVDGTAIEGRSASEVLSDIAAAPAAGSSNIVTTGALNSGSITSGFGAIDNGASAITTTGVITGGSLDVDNININGNTIGSTDTNGNITVDPNGSGQINLSANVDVTGTMTAAGLTVDTSTLHVDATNNRVGIATVSPERQLHVEGAGLIKNTSGEALFKLQAANNSNSILELADTDDGNVGRIQYEHDNNAMLLYTNDSERLRVTSAGSVGIGTASPTIDGSLAGLSVNSSGTVLHVNDGDGATLKLTDPATGANRGLGITLQGTSAAISNCESGELRFGTGNAERMRLDASGNLLHGKTASGIANNGIELRANNDVLITKDGATALYLNRKSSDGEIIEFRKDGTGVGVIGTIGGDMVAGTGDTGLRFHDGADQVYPSNTNGSGRDNAIDLGNSGARFKHGYFANTVYTASVAGITDNDTYINFANNNIMQFITGGSERVRITSGTELLVGMTGARGIGNVFDANCSELGAGYITLNRDDTASSAQITFGKNGAVAGSIVTTTGTTYNTTSDIRLKQDIEPLVATDKLMAMNPVSYNWKAEPDGPRSMGFIAQEMADVMPEAVSTGDDDDAMMSMDYGRITPILVSALQDAHRKIEQLEQRIAKIETLEARITALEAS